MYDWNDVQYFYWDWDFYKKYDYEPIKIYKAKNDVFLLSRFHWHVGTVWVSLTDKTKPHARFVLGTHVPIAKSKSYATSYVEIPRKLRAMKALEYLKEQIRLTEVSYAGFRLVLGSVSFPAQDKPKSYSSLIVHSKVDKKYKFTKESLHGLIIIGDINNKEIKILLDELKTDL